MFRSFSDIGSSDPTSGDRRREQHIPTTTKGAGVHGVIRSSNNYHGGRISNDHKIRVVRDRTNETQTTAEESQATVSSLSGIYSADLLKEIYPPVDSFSGSDDLEYDVYQTSYAPEYIVSISMDRDFDNDDDDSSEVVDEVDLDGRSQSTTVTGNQVLYAIPYTNQPSMRDIVKSSSWVEDKPFDEESILNMSDLGDGDQVSYYSKNTIPVKEYILPPPSPPPPVSAPPSFDKDDGHKPSGSRNMDQIIEIAPYTEAQRSLGCVEWGSNKDEKENAAADTVPWDTALFDATESTISSSKNRSYKSKQHRESRRLKICIIVGCLVTVLCLVMIVVAVALSRKDNDLSNAAAASSQTAAPSVANSAFGTLEPSLRVTAAPLVAPTSAPITNPWLDDTSSPTANAADDPTPMTTASPTGSPTPKPTNNPTASTASPAARPTESPSVGLTASPTVTATELAPTPCTSKISVAQDCFFMSDNVLVVQFENCNPEQDDWVGLYPDGSAFLEESSGVELLSNDWVTWAWSCGDQSCEMSPAVNGFPLAVDPDDPAFNLLNLRAYLVRASDNGPPYEVIAKSDSFAIIDPCNP